MDVAEVTIRRATRADARALSELAKRTWSDAFGASVEPEDEAAELARKRSPAYFADALRGRTILVAEADGTLVGYAELGDVDIAGIEARPGDQELHRVYVETGLQRRGIGRRLVEAALRHPSLARAERVYLQVWEENERAIRLYESFGFHLAGTTTFTIGSGGVGEDLVMVREEG